MNACHDCEPTHNRDVRERGRCYCPCHSPEPWRSVRQTDEADGRGRRVRLLHVNDEWSDLAPGALGTVMLVDGMGTVHVRWDDGSSLGLIAADGDRWEYVAE